MSYTPPAVEDLGSLQELTQDKDGNTADMYNTALNGSMLAG